MKLYLLVSGLFGLAIMLMYIAAILTISSNDIVTNIKNILCLYCTCVVSEIFNLIWNVIGAIIFWGSIYNENKCNSNVSTYIYVSLIIKFICNVLVLLCNSSQKKSEY